LRSGHCVQLLIPGNTFHTARLIGRRQWFLGVSTAWPDVVSADVEIGNVEELAEDTRQLPVIYVELLRRFSTSHL
jgi:hypothetical protein